jgi:hypothetical protein
MTGGRLVDHRPPDFMVAGGTRPRRPGLRSHPARSARRAPARPRLRAPLRRPGRAPPPAGAPRSADARARARRNPR